MNRSIALLASLALATGLVSIATAGMAPPVTAAQTH